MPKQKITETFIRRCRAKAERDDVAYRLHRDEHGLGFWGRKFPLPNKGAQKGSVFKAVLSPEK